MSWRLGSARVGSNYAFKPIAEQALRSIQTIVPQRLNAALDLPMNLDALICEFRLASRELFNRHFRVENPYENGGWTLEERFSELQTLLFEMLVKQPSELPLEKYGLPQPKVSVELKLGDFAPLLINREIDSGYWDYPIREVGRQATLRFISFFDWDQLGVRDNMYVRVVIHSWPGASELEGKHALIGASYVQFGAV